MESDPTSRSAATIAAELDAAHERAHRAYAARDTVAYMAICHPELEYTQRDGRTIGWAQLARDVQTQLERVSAATTEFYREALELGAAGTVTEILEQQARFEVRVFGIVHRAWSIRRRSRYEWLRGASEWQLRRAEVLVEEILPARTWLGLK